MIFYKKNEGNQPFPNVIRDNSNYEVSDYAGFTVAVPVSIHLCRHNNGLVVSFANAKQNFH